MIVFNHAGTFDIQDIQVTTNSSGSIIVNCALINGSQAAGVLIVAYSISDISEIYYKVAQRNDEREIQAEISCLPGQSYNVLLYVIDENGLPLKKAASLPLTRSFNNQQYVDTSTDQCKISYTKILILLNISVTVAGADLEEEIEYNISIANEGNYVCIECRAACVAIIHQNISQINTTNGFLNISHIVLVNKTTENETVSECIQGIDLIDYQIGIISLIKSESNKTAEDLQLPDGNNGTQNFTDSVSNQEDGTATVIAIAVSSVLAIIGH
jgi:hypothetical protein